MHPMHDTDGTGTGKPKARRRWSGLSIPWKTQQSPLASTTTLAQPASLHELANEYQTPLSANSAEPTPLACLTSIAQHSDDSEATVERPALPAKDTRLPKPQGRAPRQATHTPPKPWGEEGNKTITDLRATIANLRAIVSQQQESITALTDDSRAAMSSIVANADALAKRDAKILRLSVALARHEGEHGVKNQQISHLTEASKRDAEALAHERQKTARLEAAARDKDAQLQELEKAYRKSEETVVSMNKVILEKEAIITATLKTDLQFQSTPHVRIVELDTARSSPSRVGPPRPLPATPSTTPSSTLTPPSILFPHRNPLLPPPSPLSPPPTPSSIRSQPRSLKKFSHLAQFPSFSDRSVLNPDEDSDDVEALLRQYEQRVKDLTDRLAECHAQLVNLSNNPGAGIPTSAKFAFAPWGGYDRSDDEDRVDATRFTVA
ncbi:hypothetical protein D9611_000994 [Ephemerocybe angulata]|uniref:Uncharacterized protein n=1 Tax=Ephemerocybe angulata TaxID=980116 RepID=A0A8H5F6T2_9AGAR|nr:hypothetical protein D9611_000994 [Tulosesus angulatus]